MKQDHFCRPCSMIAPGDETDCAACRGELDAEQIETRKRELRLGGMATHFWANRTRRLQGFVRFKSE